MCNVCGDFRWNFVDKKILKLFFFQVSSIRDVFPLSSLFPFLFLHLSIYWLCESTRIVLDDWMMWWIWKFSEFVGMMNEGNSCLMSSKGISCISCWSFDDVVMTFNFVDGSCWLSVVVLGCNWSNRGIFNEEFVDFPLAS